MTVYIFTLAAQRDLREITLYTGRTWSRAQARRYTDALKEGIVDLAEGRIRFKNPDGFPPSMRMAHIEHHNIFLRMRENAPPLVEAIFHERSDYMRRLTVRLQPRFISGGGNKI